jgi:hypothetical protein
MNASNSSCPAAVENAGLDTVVLAEDWSVETLASIVSAPQPEHGNKTRTIASAKSRLIFVPCLCPFKVVASHEDEVEFRSINNAPSYYELQGRFST